MGRFGKNSKKTDISIFNSKYNGDFSLILKDIEDGKTKYKNKENSPIFLKIYKIFSSQESQDEQGARKICSGKLQMRERFFFVSDLKVKIC